MAKINIKKFSINYGIKNLKRTLYKGRAHKFRKFITVMLLSGVVVTALWFCRYAYLGYAEATANIILSYPEIAFSDLPDKSRFTYYYLTSDENINTALDIMHANGLYNTFTVDDLRNSFLLYNKFEGSAASSVAEQRSSGNDFSFVSNNYSLTYIQPHDLKNGNLLEKVFTPDNSDIFLKALIEANRINIAEVAGGINGFKDLVVVDNAGSYDYSEKLKVYRTKIREIQDYITFINNDKTEFVSRKHNMTLKDIEGKYAFLVSSDLDSISNFVDSSALSKDIDLAVNKLTVNIENNTLKYNKHIDRSVVSGYAINNYDHTFTENLISVVRDDDYGLYQARPKTAFDKVVEKKHSADENVADYGAQLVRFREDLAKYSAARSHDEEYERQKKKCDELMASFEEKYAKLSETAVDVITEFYNEANEKYITAKIEKKSLFTKELLVKCGIVFLLAATLAFIAMMLISVIHDNLEIRKKKQLINELKKTSKE